MPSNNEHPEWRQISFYNQDPTDSDIIESTCQIDLERSRHLIFVYCDLVDYTSVGGVRVPLLRSSIITGSYGELTKEEYRTPIYVPLRRTVFDTIEVELRSEDGSLIPFETGVSCITIHFKQVED